MKTTLTCKTCKKDKPLSAFYASNHSHCKRCICDRQRGPNKLKELPAVEQIKMMRVMSMIKDLQHSHISVAHLARRYEMTERTINRYLNLIEALNIPLEQDFYDNYFIADDNCPLCGKEHATNNEKQYA